MSDVFLNDPVIFKDDKIFLYFLTGYKITMGVRTRMFRLIITLPYFDPCFHVSDCAVTIHAKNLPILMTETYKTRN